MMKQPKHRVIAIVFASVALAGATQAPNAMAAETIDVEIVDNKNDRPVFKTPDIEIQQKDSVRWIVKDGREHRLKAVSPSNAFKETEDFDDTKEPPVERTFKDPEVTGVISYRCEKHPTTMKGTITVK